MLRRQNARLFERGVQLMNEIRCNVCEFRQLRNKYHNGGLTYAYCIASSSSRYIGHCRPGLTGLKDDTPPEWCPKKEVQK